MRLQVKLTSLIYYRLCCIQFVALQNLESSSSMKIMKWIFLSRFYIWMTTIVEVHYLWPMWKTGKVPHPWKHFAFTILILFFGVKYMVLSFGTQNWTSKGGIPLFSITWELNIVDSLLPNFWKWSIIWSLIYNLLYCLVDKNIEQMTMTVFLKNLAASSSIHFGCWWIHQLSVLLIQHPWLV